ncbi:MAG TPA: penicillin-binding transpeptidase domain-containing protein [Thermoleophilaceae bacterium]|nr:penicillin-binding transpeptidase domain-containing protein [Thermoleophilaceae bacterium]
MSLLAGLAVGGGAQSGAERTARDFAAAWERGDVRAMHRLLTPEARRDYPLRRFRRAYERAASTATATAVEAGAAAGERDGGVLIPVDVRTRVFGRVAGPVVIPVTDERVDWSPELVFPSLQRGQRLTRGSAPPERARLLARNGRVLAEGPADARGSPLTGIADSIAGSMDAEETRAERRRLYSLGFPPDWPVGQSGLEEAFEERLRGRPGGELIAGGRRVLARARPRRARDVHTTIAPRLQDAAVLGLAGRFGGVAALDPRNGEVLALAGIAFSAPQPPGSTFKIVTTTAALEARAVKLRTEFPVQTAAIVDGVELENANGESCGGSFRESFAHSCNSVFGPLGVEVGADRLVDVAERYGWNQEPTIPGEVASTLPPAREIVTPLEVASTAIGQFRTLATPLQMVSVAQTIANGGVRRVPTLALGEHAPPVRVTSRRVARTIESLMIDVVDYGTGTAAAIEGVKVAGKTGTAELEDTRDPETGETLPSDPSNTDAWFTAYAPARRPRIAVAVMLVRAGAGGATAAPAARVVLDAAL